MACGRRMFLASLICAHKFLHDKTYKNSAWSKVSGLAVHEINHAEQVMLQLLDYRLYVKKDTYDQWMDMLQNHLKMQPFTTQKSPEEDPILSSVTKPTQPTAFHLGMATPVETNASVCGIVPSVQLSCPTGLPSPPEPTLKRKHQDDHSIPTKRRVHA
ncbi:hypothetical protein CLU79DRAFT_750083 [Phycomyces nitens]|nr:hypothetical protein CLU79DRAFT_750083 [Phycomyces nitens]